MKTAVIVVAVMASGCDQLFGLRRIDETRFDAAVYFQYDGAVPLDTAGWPTSGGVVPTPCVAGSVANEDGDAHTDECDNCPLDENDQGDADTDGIGDACDPHPMYAVERRARFDGFNGTTLDSGSRIGGEWSVTGGELVQTSSNNIQALFVIAGGPWREPRLHVKLDNVRRTGTVGNFHVGVHMFGGTADRTEPDGLNCRLHFGVGNGDLELRRIRNTQPIATAAAPNARIDDSVTLFGGPAQLGAPPQCDSARTTLPPTQLTAHALLPLDPTDPAPTALGLWTANARADFQAIDIYETTYP